MLEEIVKVLEVKDEDSNRKAMVKAIAKGAVEGCIIVGALHFVDGVFKSNKK